MVDDGCGSRNPNRRTAAWVEPKRRQGAVLQNDSCRVAAFWSAVPCHRFGQRPVGFGGLGSGRKTGKDVRWSTTAAVRGTQTGEPRHGSNQNGDKAPYSKMAAAAWPPFGVRCLVTALDSGLQGSAVWVQDRKRVGCSETSAEPKSANHGMGRTKTATRRRTPK